MTYRKQWGLAHYTSWPPGSKPVKTPVGKHKLNVRHPVVRRAPLPKPIALKAPGTDRNHSQFSLLAGYQQQIAELEGTVTHLLQRVMDLNAAVSESIDARAHLSDLFQNAPVGYVIHDQAGLISGINRTARMMLGFETEPRALSLAQIVRRDQFSLWLDHQRRASTLLRATTDVVLRGHRGRLIPVQLVTLVMPVPRSQRIFRTILIDDSQRCAAEAALASTQRDYHVLIDTIEGIVWAADARTLEVDFVSGYAERLLGYPIANWKDAGFWQNRIYVEDRDRVSNAIARAVANRQPLRIDYRVRAADRRILWLHDNIITLEREGRLRLLGVAVDVTEQHETQERLHQSHELLEQRVNERTAELRATLQEIEAFSYSISHDLRAPLRAMLGFAEVALRWGGDQLQPEVKDCLRRIMDAGVRADRLVQDVLAYSRVSRDKFHLTRVDLDQFVRDTIAQYPDFQPPKSDVRVQSPLSPVVAHEALLGQCLTNLLSNAVKFVAPGTAPQVKVWTESKQDSHCTRLWIQDNGIGIAAQNVGRIFNIFERVNSNSQYSGTGIGLAIVRKAVERMGGVVGVESQPGQGSKFWIQLKAA